jgi:hypothetical protein
MGAIADAVNAFKSDAVQQAAFSALIDAAVGTGAKSNSTAENGEDGFEASQPKSTRNAKGKGSIKKGAIPRGQWTFNRSLNLRPTGKKPFVDFVEEKQPKSNEDRYALAVYYLSEIAAHTTVTISDIGSVFRLMPSWREPKQLDAGLRMASSRKGTLDTSNLEDIKLTPHGRNYVEHDLPSQKDKP